MTTRPPEPSSATEFEFRIRGHLGDHWSSWFDGLALTRELDGTTVLRGAVADQAALHGVLQRLRDLGVDLVSIQERQD